MTTDIDATGVDLVGRLRKSRGMPIEKAALREIERLRKSLISIAETPAGNRLHEETRQVARDALAGKVAPA